VQGAAEVTQIGVSLVKSRGQFLTRTAAFSAPFEATYSLVLDIFQ